MKTTAEMIAVMQAYEDGKKIQFYSKISKDWEDATAPVWAWGTYDYRIKPEPKYRPYESVDEMLCDYKHRVCKTNDSENTLPLILLKRSDIEIKRISRGERMTYQEAIKYCEAYLPETDLKSFIIGILQLQIEKEEENSNHILDYITMIDAVAVYGKEKQILIAVEELAELQKALLKYLRSSHDKHVKPVDALVTDVKEEMADVDIMLQQLEIIFGACDSEKAFKLNRLRERLREGRSDDCSTVQY